MLRAIAARSLEDAGRSPDQIPDPADPASVFADDLGHRRPVDRPFFAWRHARTRGNPPDTATPDTHANANADPDTQLWHALTDKRADPLRTLASFDAGHARDRTDGGALFGQHDGHVPLEVWTERELSAAHALGWLARTRRDPSLATRLDAAMAWHLENLQPDNATNHPWAVHLFLFWSDRHDNPSGRMYAETLLHNCQVSMGRADAFSAHILIDAADWLDHDAPRP